MQDLQERKIPTGLGWLLVGLICLGGMGGVIAYLATDESVAPVKEEEGVEETRPYRDEGGNVEVQIPVSWVEVPLPEEGIPDNLLFIVGNDSKKVMLQVTHHPLDHYDSAASHAEARRREFIGNTDGSRTTGITELTINGRPAAQLQFQGKIRVGALAARPFDFIQTSIEGQEDYWSVLAFSHPLRYEENRAVMQRATKSFRELGVEDAQDEPAEESDYAGGPEGGDTTTEKSLLARLRKSKDPGRLVGIWRSYGYDRRPGARLRLVEAYPYSIDRVARTALLKSIRETPLGTGEALALLENKKCGALFRPIILDLGTRTDDADRIVEGLKGVKETNDLLVEETLLKLGRYKQGISLRLLQARGEDWAYLIDASGTRVLNPELKKLLEDEDERDLLLESEHPEVRRLAADIVVDLEDPKVALKLLGRQLKDEDRSVRESAVSKLGFTGNPLAAFYLARALLGKKRVDHNLVAYSLGRLPKRKTLRVLERMFARKDYHDRMAALLAAGYLHRSEALPLVLKGLDDKNRFVQETACNVVASLCQESSVFKRRLMPGRERLEFLATDAKVHANTGKAAKTAYRALTGKAILAPR